MEGERGGGERGGGERETGRERFRRNENLEFYGLRRYY